MEKLSIIVPCYNEARSIQQCLERVLAVTLPFGVTPEVLVVDDGSRDTSREVVREFARAHPVVTLLEQPRNLGKGAALRRGFEAATGDIIVIQDADLEYDPNDFTQMITLFRLPAVDVVFGSRRLLPGNPVSGASYYLGAQIINFLTNVLYGSRISDQFTCYKMFRRELLAGIPLRSNRFEIDAELTAKLLRNRHRVQEVPITYRPRSVAEGKKIRWRDGVSWIWQIIKHRFSNPRTW